MPQVFCSCFCLLSDIPVTITKGNTSHFEVTNHYEWANAYVKKTVSNPDVLSQFPLQATFYVYSDAACTMRVKDLNTNDFAVITVDSKVSMNSSTVKLPLGTYYVKEISCSDAYVLNEEVHKIVLSEDGKTYFVEVENKLEPGKGKVEKNY